MRPPGSSLARRAGRGLLAFLNRSVALLVALLPPLVFVLWGVQMLVARLDTTLADATPVLAEEAGRYLGRPVRIERLGPDLTFRRLVDLWRRPDSVGRFPIVLEGLELGVRPDERLQVGRSYLARARRVTLEISAPGLWRGKPGEEALPFVRAEGVDLALVRTASGDFPVAHLLPDSGQPSDPRKPPFRTRVEVEDSSLWFRDYAAKTGRRVEDNHLVAVNGAADLRGGREVHFEATARARPGTDTAARLRSGLSVEGMVARGIPGARPDSPGPNVPRFLVHFSIGDADLAYWQPYWVPIQDLTLLRGRGEVVATILGPAGLPPAPPEVTARIRFRQTDLKAAAAHNLPVQDAAGTLTVDGRVVGLRIAARVRGQAVSAEGTLSDFGLPGRTPQLAIRGQAPALSVDALRSAFPQIELPRELGAAGTLSVTDVAVNGPLDKVQAEGKVGLGAVSWKGFPSVRNLTGVVRWTKEGLGLESLQGALDGGGKLVARVRFSPSTRSGQVEARVDGAELRRFAALVAAGPRFAVTGKGSARVSGRFTLKGGLRGIGDARVRADGLKVGALNLPDASALAHLDGRIITVRSVRLGGPAGVAGLKGTIDLDRGLKLDGSLVGVDLAKVGAIAGIAGLGGVGSVRIVAEGPLRAPAITLRDLSVLEPRLRIDGRLLTADAIRGERIRVGLTDGRSIDARLVEPLRVSLYPAEVLVSGTVRGPLKDPRLALNGRVENLDFGRIVQLAGGMPARYAPQPLRESPDFLALTRDLGWADEPPPVAGRVTEATARIDGTLRHPRVAGKVALKQIRIGRYPVERGELDVVWQNETLTVRSAKLNASAGEAVASGSLAPDGTLTGSFEIAALKLDALSPLTESAMTLAGTVRVDGRLSGDRRDPVVEANVTADGPVRLAGVPLEGLTAREIRAVAHTDVSPAAVRLSIGAVGAKLAGASLALKDVSYSLPERNASLEAEVKGAAVGELVRVLREAPQEDTSLGAALQRLADSVPADVEGQFGLTGRASGTIADDGRFENAKAQLALNGQAIQIGPTRFTTLTTVAALDDRRVTVQKLSLENESAVLEGSGTLDLPEKSDDPIGLDLKLESLQPSLDLVRALVPEFPLYGALDTVTIVARGTTAEPQLQATLEGSGLIYRRAASPDKPPVTTATSVAGATPEKSPAPRPVEVVLDHLRLNARLRRDPGGDMVLSLDDGLLQKGSEEVRLDVALPVDLDKRRVLAGRPIPRMEVQLKELKLETLATLADVPVSKVVGALNGRLALEGSLNEPRLAGDLRLQDANVSFPKVGNAKREPLNAISDLDVEAVFSGQTITLQGTRLTLGPPPGGRAKSGGEATVAGQIVLENLEDFTRLFQPRTAGDEPPRLRGRFDLTANLASLRPDIENVTGLLGIKDAHNLNGLGEAASGLVNGTVTIKGPLLAPVIATAQGNPLRLAEASLRLPRASNQTGPSVTPSFDPKLDINVDIPTDASLKVLSSAVAELEVRGRGSMEVSGSVSAPRVQGALTPTGGVLRYPLARLSIQRGGIAQFAFEPPKGTGPEKSPDKNGVAKIGLTLSGVTAEGRITGIVARTARSGDTGSGLVNSEFSAAGARGEMTTYRIFAEMSGVIDLGKDSATDLLQQISLTSNPPLTKLEILELLGGRRQLDLIASGDTDQAIRELQNRLIGNNFIDRLTGLFSDNLRSALGLDAFDLSYNLNGTAFVRIVRRLPEPLDRFTVEISRSFSTRSQLGQAVEYRYGINYELFQFRPRGRIQPRLLLGAAVTSEQKDTLFFLRGTISY